MASVLILNVQILFKGGETSDGYNILVYKMSWSVFIYVKYDSLSDIFYQTRTSFSFVIQAYVISCHT
jgi:hypothetical protein